MSSEKKVSAMIIEVSGDLFDAVNSQKEMQAHLDLVITAWNMATEPLTRSLSENRKSTAEKLNLCYFPLLFVK